MTVRSDIVSATIITPNAMTALGAHGCIRHTPTPATPATTAAAVERMSKMFAGLVSGQNTCSSMRERCLIAAEPSPTAMRVATRGRFIRPRDGGGWSAPRGLLLLPRREHVRLPPGLEAMDLL